VLRPGAALKIVLSPTIETARLNLTTWCEEDWVDFRAIATDPEVMRYITGGMPWADDTIRQFVARQIALYGLRGYCRWKLTEKATGEFAGFCGLGFWRDYVGSPEIGWWLARRFWGRGLASEAAFAALRDAFERVRVDRVISIAEVANRASIRIMEKLGLVYDCEIEEGGVRLVRYAMDRARYGKEPYRVRK
jgi:RimJ/RimL family protein N-acetyltransferase